MTRPQAAWRPPMRNGVSASRVAVSAGPWTTVLDFLQARLPAATDWPERLARGDVLHAHGEPAKAVEPAHSGLLLWYWRQPPAEAAIPFDIEVLYQDAHIVVVDKPHFMPVTPGGRHLHETVLVRLKRLLGNEDLAPVHRLDLETAGLVLFTATTHVRHAYHAMMREQQVHRVYEAVAPWRADLVLPTVHRSRLQAQDGSLFMQMLTLPGEPNSATRIELIRHLALVPEDGWGLAGCELAHYRLTPQTGRKHQLRAHLCELGIPIAGDRIYPRLWPEPPPGNAPDFTHPLQLLARELCFNDPISGLPRRFTSGRVLQLTQAESRPT
jgi:tRNA pseudouridine32 synthase / 23S rRNA pseudouridine746 synthase